MPSPVKQPTTYDEQILKLRNRGCRINDETFCRKVLAQVNYYRLSAYFLPYRLPDGTYKPETDFYAVYRTHEFDRKMHSLLFTAIEDVEIFLRSRFAYYHAHTYGSMGYMAPGNYNPRHDHAKFITRIEREKENNKKLSFVQHHITKYGGDFPIWVIMELFSFGMVSYFYSDLTVPDQKFLAKDLYDSIPKKIQSWLRCCTDLRNMCAHSDRLYYRQFTSIPITSPLIEEKFVRRLYGAIMALKWLYPDRDKWNREIYPALYNLIYNNAGYIRMDHIGFPPDWETGLQK